ncbi:hypothetical protein MRX96_020303 [Rhipicephalus microplus]
MVVLRWRSPSTYAPCPPVDHPELAFFEKMKYQLWDHVDKITEKFILWILKDVNDLVRAQHVGNPPCFAAYKGYEKSLGILCRGIIRNVNAFWTALGFCLWMFLVLGMVSHFLSKYFLRMVNWTYDGSEVESYSRSPLVRVATFCGHPPHPSQASPVRGTRQYAAASTGSRPTQAEARSSCFQKNEEAADSNHSGELATQAQSEPGESTAAVPTARPISSPPDFAKPSPSGAQEESSTEGTYFRADYTEADTSSVSRSF